MKRVVYAPAALDRLDGILNYTLKQVGVEQAERYAAQLVDRLTALAAGRGPNARPCALLMRDIRHIRGLNYYREGSHYLILRETADTLELVEIFHARMDLDKHLRALADTASNRSEDL